MALPTGRILTVADAVVTAINSGASMSTNYGVTATRGYSFGYKLSELATLRVIVRPFDFTKETMNPTEEMRLYTLQVGVLKSVNKNDEAQIDLYANLALSINLLFPLESSLTVSSVAMQVKECRPFPLFYQDRNTLDDPDNTTVRFDSRLQLTLGEMGRATSETT